jgi:hypothetical protein
MASYGMGRRKQIRAPQPGPPSPRVASAVPDARIDCLFEMGTRHKLAGKPVGVDSPTARSFSSQIRLPNFFTLSASCSSYFCNLWCVVVSCAERFSFPQEPDPVTSTAGLHMLLRKNWPFPQVSKSHATSINRPLPAFFILSK